MEMFYGEQIGVKDNNGIELCCGDKVTVLEEFAEYDYTNPILDFDAGTCRPREIIKYRKVYGVIRYETCWPGFAFIPDAEAHMPYVRKLLCDYCFKKIWREN